MAMQAAKVKSSPNPMQSRERVIERVNAWPDWKRNAFSYRTPESFAKEKVRDNGNDEGHEEKK